MVCPKCGSRMELVSKWIIAPYGGYKCTNTSCGFKVAKKELE